MPNVDFFLTKHYLLTLTCGKIEYFEILIQKKYLWNLQQSKVFDYYYRTYPACKASRKAHTKNNRFHDKNLVLRRTIILTFPKPYSHWQHYYFRKLYYKPICNLPKPIVIIFIFNYWPRQFPNGTAKKNKYQNILF